MNEDEGGEGAAVDEGEPEEEDLPEDRRIDARHLACFPAYVEVVEGVQRSALIRDLSVSGALLLTRARLAIGDTVKLSLHLREGLPPRAITARVVREEKRPSEMVHPWTKSIAVCFDEPIPELEEEAKALADRQAALAGRRAGG